MDEAIWKISDVNNTVKQVIEGALAPFWLEGEIGTLSVHSSGHVYLVLKDEKSQLRAVLWRGAKIIKDLQLATGSKIIAYGQLAVYEARGEYQFNIKSIKPFGLGDLQRKFEEIKAKLLKEGLFDESRKKPIPLLPRIIGVVTSPTGAAIQDFLSIINRRFPNVIIKIYPAAVQGKGAEIEVANGVKFFNTKCNVDVIVVTRGGGSMEDLWAFNDENLARTIAASKIPVISAVGHEIDYTICDFVADLRAKTPSEAAELVIKHQNELKEKIENFKKRLKISLEFFIEKRKRKFQNLSQSYVFKDPIRLIREKQQFIDELLLRAKHSISMKLERVKRKFEILIGKLETISPKAVLQRGYSILRVKKTNTIITSPDLPDGTLVNAILKEGALDLIVKK